MDLSGGVMHDRVERGDKGRAKGRLVCLRECVWLTERVLLIGCGLCRLYQSHVRDLFYRGASSWDIHPHRIRRPGKDGLQPSCLNCNIHNIRRKILGGQESYNLKYNMDYVILLYL